MDSLLLQQEEDVFSGRFDFGKLPISGAVKKFMTVQLKLQCPTVPEICELSNAISLRTVCPSVFHAYFLQLKDPKRGENESAPLLTGSLMKT